MIPLHNTDWALLVLLLLGSLAVYLKINFPGRFHACWVGIRNLRPMHQFYRPEQLRSDLFLFWVETMTLMLLPMTLLMGLRYGAHSSLNSGDWSTYLHFVLGFIAFQFIQYAGLLLFGWAIDRWKEATQLLYVKRFSLRWSSFLFLPANFIALFALDGKSWGGAVLLGALIAVYGYSVVRSLMLTSRNNPVQIALLFYYLCGLEILPVWCLVHWGLTGL